MNLSDFKASLFFNGAVLKQGLALLHLGLDVRAMHWRGENGPVWSIKVLGEAAFSGFRVHDRTWTFDTYCSHCDSENCEHLAALALHIESHQMGELLRWQAHLDQHLLRHGFSNYWHLPELPDYESAFNAWISTQAMAASAESVAAAHSDSAANPLELPLAVLAPIRHSSPEPWLRLCYARPLKSKAREQMSKPDWRHTFNDPALRRALKLDTLTRRYAQWASTNVMNGDAENSLDQPVLDEFGMDVVQMFAKACRLYGLDPHEQRPVGPLTWSDPRLLDWHWEEVAQRYLRVKPSPSIGQPLIGPIPLYVDLQTKVFGPLLLGELSAARAASVCQAPPIPKDWLSSNALAPTAVRCLPRPPETLLRRSSRLIQGLKPVPVLRVDLDGIGGTFSIDLAFLYEDIRCYFPLSADRVQFLTKSSETIELCRDIDAESAAHLVAKASGLVAGGPDGSLRFSGDLSAQRAAFGALLSSEFAAFLDAGFQVETLPDWNSKVLRTNSVDGGFGHDAGDLTGTSAFLQFSMGFYVDGKRYNLLPLIEQLLEAAGGAQGIDQMAESLTTERDASDLGPPLWVVDEDGRWIGFNRAQIAPWLVTLAELAVTRKAKDLAKDVLHVSRIEALRLEAQSPDVQLGSNAAVVIRELLDAKANNGPLAIDGFKGVLEAFQCAGVRWMGVLDKYRLGGILGDDRGLGKTWQCIAHLAQVKAQGTLTNPALIVVPATQIHHWRHLFYQLAPCLNVITLVGPERASLIPTVAQFDALLTSWDSVVRYVEPLRAQRFHVAFLDETEKIHNPSTLVSKGLRLLDIGYEVALNGSPLENSYGDVWAVVDAVLPGYLGTDSFFKKTFRIPIEQEGDVGQLRKLRTRLAPFLLRRQKGESGVVLPPVIHQDVALTLTGPQANLYELIRLSTEQAVQAALASSGIRCEPTSILPALTRLRQVCCDPSLTEVGREKGITDSVKLAWLEPKLEELLSQGSRVLLVGFFVEFFQRIAGVLNSRGIPFSKIVGSMPVKRREVEKALFKAGKTKVFLLGLKSGGRGTDLPEADTVIHLDPWYNPKAHDQATDRAHRIGQTNTVTAYRLFVEGSIEQRVIAIQDRKRLFADSLDSSEIFDEHRITHDDIREMLKPLQAADELM